MQENGENPETTLLALKGEHVCLWAHAADGYYQVLKDGAWSVIDGGDQYVVGEVTDIGVELWGRNYESYVVVDYGNKVFLTGIKDGTVFEEGSLRLLMQLARHFKEL